MIPVRSARFDERRKRRGGENQLLRIGQVPTDSTRLPRCLRAFGRKEGGVKDRRIALDLEINNRLGIEISLSIDFRENEANDGVGIFEADSRE